MIVLGKGCSGHGHGLDIGWAGHELSWVGLAIDVAMLGWAGLALSGDGCVGHDTGYGVLREGFAGYELGIA
jgi:hypothetical protein